MLLIFKHLNDTRRISSNHLIVYILLLMVLMYFSVKLCMLLCIIDLYSFVLLNNFSIYYKADNKKKSDLKMEIEAEGVNKSKNNDLLDTLIEYSDRVSSKID